MKFIIGTSGTSTPGDIKTAYESNDNTNAFTDALKTLLEAKKVKDVTTDTTNDYLVITYTDDSTANLNLNDIVTDIHVSGASLDATTNVLTLTSADGGADVTVDLSDFVNSSELNDELVKKQDILSEGAFIDGDKTKLDGIEDAANVNVQSDYNETDDTKDSFVNNKPDLSIYQTTSNMIDEDDMASDSETKYPTQQSVKKYTDDGLAGKLNLHGTADYTMQGKIFANNEINYANGFNMDNGIAYFNYRGADKPITTLMIRNGKDSGKVRISNIQDGSNDNDAASIGQLSNKTDKIASGTEDNFTSLDDTGNIKDSGIKNGDLVHTTGDETIGGVKTFSDNVVGESDIKGHSLTAGNFVLQNTNEFNGTSGSQSLALGYRNTEKIELFTGGNDSTGHKTFSAYSNGDTDTTGGKMRLRGPSKGKDTIDEDLVSGIVGPDTQRDNTIGTYLPGLGFNHLLSYGSDWDSQLHGWIGSRLISTNNSELSALVFATTTETGDQHTKFPTEKMCILPNGNVGINTKNPAKSFDVVGEAKVNGVRTRSSQFASESLTGEQVRYGKDVTYRITCSSPNNNENFGVIIKEFGVQYNTTNIWNSTKAIMVKQPGSGNTVEVKVNNNTDTTGTSKVSTTVTAVDSANFDVKLSIGNNYTNAMLELHTIGTSYSCIITKQ